MTEAQRRLEQLKTNLNQLSGLSAEYQQKIQFTNTVLSIRPQGTLKGAPYGELDKRELSYNDGTRYGRLNAVFTAAYEESKSAKLGMMIIASIIGLAVFLIWCILDPLMGWNFLFDKGENLITFFQENWFTALIAALIVAVPFVGVCLLFYFVFVRKPLERAVYAKYQDKYEEARLSDLREYDLEVVLANGYCEKDIPLLKNQIQETRDRIEKDDILAANFKDIATVERIIGYFQQGRAETVKEAINLMLSENAEQARHSALLEMQRVQREQVERLNQQLNETNSRLQDLQESVDTIDTTTYIDVRVNRQ